jgi:hypothetical protein
LEKPVGDSLARHAGAGTGKQYIAGQFDVEIANRCIGRHHPLVFVCGEIYPRDFVDAELFRAADLDNMGSEQELLEIVR